MPRLFSKIMNICYCFDRNYFEYTLFSANSVKEHNPDAKFYFFTNDLQFAQYKQISELGQIIEYDESLLSEFGDELCGYKHVSTKCFVRLLIPLYLPEENRALYLDGDTVCKGNLQELYNADFENNYIIGCKGTDVSKRQAQELNIEYYINSGVLLFNIPVMNEHKYFEELKANWRGCLGLPEVFSADETIINYVFHKKIKLISEKFNYCFNRRYRGREIKPENVVIWHITGASKGNMKNV